MEERGEDLSRSFMSGNCGGQAVELVFGALTPILKWERRTLAYVSKVDGQYGVLIVVALFDFPLVRSATI
jgi:hypothetical protein